MKAAHKHFCYMCAPFVRAWWRCTGAPCVKPEAWLCKRHRMKESK